MYFPTAPHSIKKTRCAHNSRLLVPVQSYHGILTVQQYKHGNPKRALTLYHWNPFKAPRTAKDATATAACDTAVVEAVLVT